MARAKAIFKPILITAVLTVVFLLAVFFCLTAYNRYLRAQQKHESINARLNMLLNNKRDAARNQSIHEDVNNFIEKAYAMGLEQERWSTFEVDLDMPVSFVEMEQLIDQCANNSAYYFKPISLQIETASQTGNQTQPNAAHGSGQQGQNDQTTKAGKKSDAQLILKGAFIVGPKDE